MLKTLFNKFIELPVEGEIAAFFWTMLAVCQTGFDYCSGLNSYIPSVQGLRVIDLPKVDQKAIAIYA